HARTDTYTLSLHDALPICVLEAMGLQLDESALTGESFPVEKRTEPSAPDAALRARSSALFQGTHVVSGTGTAVVVATSGKTELRSEEHTSELQSRGHLVCR